MHFFVLQQSADHYTLLFLALLYEVVLSFILLFLYSELGERVSGGLNGICDTFDEFDWYRLSTGNQKSLPLMLAMTQREVQFPCFGSICCIRETFEKVF